MGKLMPTIQASPFLNLSNHFLIVFLQRTLHPDHEIINSFPISIQAKKNHILCHN